MVLATICNDITNSSPGGSLITFIEWYSFTCMLFTFAPLMEYGIVLGMLRPKKAGRVDSKQATEERVCLEQVCITIDAKFSVFIKALFAAFMVIYWTMAIIHVV